MHSLGISHHAANVAEPFLAPPYLSPTMHHCPPNTILIQSKTKQTRKPSCSFIFLISPTPLNPVPVSLRLWCITQHTALSNSPTHKYSLQ